MQLTDQQRAVVEHGDGHARVFAVAGAGKTATMVARVARLLERGVEPSRILVLMFNRAAREDFAARLSTLAPDGGALPQVRTFHSIGLRLGRTLTRWGALPPRQLLEGEWQRERLARQVLQHHLADEPEQLAMALEEERIEALLQFCDLVKAECVSPQQLYERGDFGSETRHFPDAFMAIERQMHDRGVMSWADLLFRPLRALHRDEQARERLQGRLDHIIVDEYQDINEVQLRLLAMLAGQSASVMAVGDARQCIYEWRGARPDAMKARFERLFGAPVDYPLSWTFRHGHGLSLMANHAIRANPDGGDQLTLSAPDNPLTRIERDSGVERLVALLRQWQHGGRALSECAVLVRSWALSVPIQLRLLREDIPFQLGREERFVFRLPLVRALAGYLELARRPGLLGDAEHLLLLYTQPGTFVSRELLAPLTDELARRGRWPDQHTALSGLKPFQKRNLKKRWALLRELTQMGDRPPAEILAHVVETLDAEKLLRRAAARREKGEEDVRLLDVLIEQAGELADDPDAFIALLRDPVIDRGPGVLLSTVHGAKGLEWPLVAVSGLNEEDFPLYSRDNPLTSASLEEERRLYYVAITRAREHLLLLSDRAGRRPSRFVEESAWQQCDRLGRALDERTQGTVEVGEPALVNRYLRQIGADQWLNACAATREAMALNAGAHWQPGEHLRHAVFGEGTIEGVEGERERCVLDVQFNAAGRRRLIASRAPIERVD
ncbi:ATP-dependent helicase [Kushneria aurantia]|uniref:DNA 3'-5' helicase n=1 Tax=Kushneria aurantia TaxID=504092 RepID=A0ABV6G7L1_9GAMM|nr:ATP-dependent helicase [Kushneria aurantia]